MTVELRRMVALVKSGVGLLLLDVGKWSDPKGVEVTQPFVGADSQFVLTESRLFGNGESCLEGGGFFLDDLRNLDSSNKEKLGGFVEPLAANDDFLIGASHSTPWKQGRNERFDS